MSIVEPDKVDKNVKGLKYLCHSGTVKKMLMNLQKLEYSDPLFYKQYQKIYSIFWKRYSSINNTFSDVNEFAIIQLLTYLNVSENCVGNLASMNFYNYGYTAIYMPYGSLEKVKCRKILVPFIINFNDSAHANLLIFDKDSKKVWRIEPNYGFESYDKLYNTAIENRLERFCIEQGYNYSGYFPASCQKMDHPGFCLFISAARYVFGIELTPELLREVIVGFLKREYNTICNKKIM